MNVKETGRPERWSIEGRKREELEKESLEISAPSCYSYLASQLTLTQPSLSPIHLSTLQPRNTSNRNQNPSITSSLPPTKPKTSSYHTTPTQCHVSPSAPESPSSGHKIKKPPQKITVPYNAAPCPQHIIFSTSMTTHWEGKLA